MNTAPNIDAATGKALADLETVNFDDLGEDVQGMAVNAAQWEKYQKIVRELTAAQGDGQGIVKVNYLQEPDPTALYASAMIVLDKAASFDGDAKTALVLAAALCDRIAVTTSGDKIRTSFTVSNIWQS